jgi:hypothetical protein
MKNFELCLISLIFLLSSPLVVAQDEEAETEIKESGNVCVNSRTIRNFDAFTDEHIYVEERSNQHYLFTMSRRCPGLRNSVGIAIKDTTSRVCSKGFGEVVYRGHGNRLESCRIGTIEVVDSRDDAKALVEQRKSDKDQADKN